MKLSVDSLTKGLEFHGEVQGKRQRYYILSSPRQYTELQLIAALAMLGFRRSPGRSESKRSH